MSTPCVLVRLLVSILLLAVLGGAAVVSGQGADIVTLHALDVSYGSCCPEDARGETGAIFVAATGRTGNPGTAAYPMQSLSEALAADALQGKTAIYLAGGEYSEADTIRLISGVSICGGYDPGTWSRTGSAATNIDVKASTAMVAQNLTELTTLSNFAITAANTAYGASSYGIKRNGCPGGLTVEHMTVAAGTGGTGTDGVDRSGYAAGGGNGTPARLAAKTA
jgi:hypothetical protein